MRTRSLVVLLALMSVAPVRAQTPAQEKPSTEKSKVKGQAEKNKEKEKAKQKEKTEEKADAAGKSEERDDSSEEARRELKAYYERRAGKPADLPPGIAKNLERGKALPPGIQRSRVPDDLAARLPKRQGEEWAMVGNRLVSVDKSGIVRQVITP